ncbi:hypothetical protein [Paeniglutamicibacter psychrophenolicus]|uniref:hypothetical protein n=1 Tax=Paeniglutamicibacter psychrophenolicus TaxID=257454 RepID=UPI00277F8A7B|nr:hypothetical protein [Paeniglutamicibacter psychrophenolicus]MDQ0096015.1 hypothetical protein [Paeniglutamicibacter psychrophenolicus]
MDKDFDPPETADPSDGSTFFDVVDSGYDKGGRIGRRIILTLVALFVLASLANVFGMDTTSTGGSPGYELTVSAPRTSRAGMDGKITVTLHAAQKISGPITVKVEQDYLDAFTTYGISPAPDGESSDGHLLVLDYDASDEKTFRLDIDGTVSEDSDLRAHGNVQVYIDGDLVASTKLRLWKVF